ncbi:hypothetical protein NDA01_21580 [Trichocoleus desertorum AS-A10]|uniref:hypothetical protein n=1 Tax=Trichocoleus desertorum TaxID=1481672 RepID=UPI0032993008
MSKVVFYCHNASPEQIQALLAEELGVRVQESFTLLAVQGDRAEQIRKAAVQKGISIKAVDNDQVAQWLD